MRGLKSGALKDLLPLFASHLAWGAWIEMFGGGSYGKSDSVAPRMGCVD